MLTVDRLSVHNSVHSPKGALCGARQHPAAGQDPARLAERCACKRDTRGRIKWPPVGRYIIEWRENGRRRRAAAGDTPAEALEAQKRKRLELDARRAASKSPGPRKRGTAPAHERRSKLPQGHQDLPQASTHQKYEYILGLFTEHVAPKSDARDITGEDMKKFLAWRKSKGFDPGTTLYTDRVILHNFFNKLGIDNPVKDVPRLPKFRKRPVAYTDAELKKILWRVRRLGTGVLLSSALDGPSPRAKCRHFTGRTWISCITRVHVTAKPQYGFLPKDWEERTVPFSQRSPRSFEEAPARLGIARWFSRLRKSHSQLPVPA